MHDGSMTKKSIGTPLLASRTYWMPSLPSTFVNSCGSITIALVPCGTTARANSGTVTIVLST